MVGTDQRFHPDLRTIARFLPRNLVTPRTVPIIRALLARVTRKIPSDIEIHRVCTGATVRVHRAPERTGALLWIHGGGYVIGAASQDDNLCRRFAADTGLTVASVDYRLAPEHPYPAALDDCEAALHWLVAQDCVDPTRIAIGGASAGGGLAAALALRMRDTGDVDVHFQLLVYPMLDDRTTPESNTPMRLWSPTSNRFGWSSYLGSADPASAVPARQELADLPPTWIGVGDCDLFMDEDLTYAERLRDNGIRCDVEVVRGAFHGFDLVAPKVGVSRRFFDSQVAALVAALQP